jgi:hypothetical protein
LKFTVQEVPSPLFVSSSAEDVPGSTRVNVGRPSNAVCPVGVRLTFL